jgi:EmrB/QacA subfamily drug resistance transporter
MSRNRIMLVTAGIMLSLFLAAMESTVVATAMPTIVGQLGGLDHYSWVFSAFMLSSTATVPLYGKLSDIYGRRRLYVIAMGLFLAGSVLSGMSVSMTHLIIARALQGLGAGGVQPLAFILIGEMFTLKQRANMQGLFSGVWGVSSIVGPLLGGFLVDQLSWRWVFYINLVPGLLAAALVAFAWRDHLHAHERSRIDYAGAGLLTASVLALLLGMVELGTPQGWALIGLAVALTGALIWAEYRAADPILPIHLFRDGLFTTATLHGVLTGWAMFGSISFIPLFVQSVLGTSATQAGITVTPMLLGWVTASIIGMRLIIRVGYRTLGRVGTATFAVGAFLMTLIGAESSQLVLMVFITMMGVGMGLSIPSFLVAVQSSVERRQLGTATSTIQFSRQIGGTLGVSAMGVALSVRLASNIQAAGLDPSLVTGLLDSLSGAQSVTESGVRLALADAMHLVFLIAFFAAALGMVAAFLTPHRELEKEVQVPGEGESPLLGTD